MSESVIQWKTKSAKTRMAAALMTDGVSFSFTKEDGIVFSATEAYVRTLIYNLMVCHGVSKRPIIEPIK